MPENHLSVDQLSKSFNERVLLDKITFGIDRGQKVALVGVNGCGKSTLLKILAGLEDVDGGEFNFQKDLQKAVVQHFQCRFSLAGKAQTNAHTVTVKVPIKR